MEEETGFLSGIAKAIVNFFSSIFGILKTTVGVTFVALVVIAMVLHCALHMWPGVAFLLYCYVAVQIAAVVALLYMIWLWRDDFVELFTMKPKTISSI